MCEEFAKNLCAARDCLRNSKFGKMEEKGRKEQGGMFLSPRSTRKLSYLRDALGVLFQLLLERLDLVRFVPEGPLELLDEAVLGVEGTFHAVDLGLEVLHPGAHVVRGDRGRSVGFHSGIGWNVDCLGVSRDGRW